MVLRARLRPGAVAGLCGLVAVGAACVAIILLGGVPGFQVLGIVPFIGFFCGYLCAGRGVLSAARQGAVAGLIASQPFAAVQLLALIRSLSEINWTLYASQVGSEAANTIHGAIMPLSLLAGALTLLVVCAIFTAVASGCSAGYYYARKAITADRLRN